MEDYALETFKELLPFRFNQTSLIQFIEGKLNSYGVEYQKDAFGNLSTELPKNADGKYAIAYHTSIVTDKIGKSDESSDITQKDNMFFDENSNSNFDVLYGVSAMLSIAKNIKDVQYEHGPILLNFTLDNIERLEGSEHIEKWPHYSFNYMVNLNNYKGDIFSVGGPASQFHNIILPISRQDLDSEKYSIIKLELTGMNAGVVNILNYNPILSAARIMTRLLESEIPFNILDFISGDSFSTVPSSYTLKIAVPKEMENTAIEVAHDSHMSTTMEYIRSEHSNFKIDTIDEKPLKAVAEVDSAMLTSLLLLIPSGVFSMSQIYKKSFETSSTLSKVELNESSFKTSINAQAIASGGLEGIRLRLLSLKNLYQKIIIESSEITPQWGTRRRGPLITAIMSSIKENEGQPKFGLSGVLGAPSIFYGKGYDEAHYASIGPKIDNFRAHGESVSVQEILRFSKIAFSIIEKVNAK